MEILEPANERELADVVREAKAQSASLEILGHGTKRDFGRRVKADRAVTTKSLTGVLSYEPDELVFTARANTLLAEAEAALAAKGQMFGFAPADWGPLFGAPKGMATLAGIAAANTCGARRVKAGAVRDHLIGCRFVNGLGEIVKAGGRVVKNVTGFDIPKLMCGAFGTLGILNELTFRVVPKPERVAVIQLRNTKVQEGLAALRRAASMPIEATGLAYAPAAMLSRSAAAGAFSSVADGIALIRVEGASGPVEEKLAQLTREFAPLEPVLVEDAAGFTLFREIDNGALLETTADLWRVVAPSSEAPAILSELAPRHWFADWAGGLLWLALPADAPTAQRLRNLAAHHGGYATLLKASQGARSQLDVFSPLSPDEARLSRNVKQAFDPMHLLNPGRMYEGI